MGREKHGLGMIQDCRIFKSSILRFCNKRARMSRSYLLYWGWMEPMVWEMVYISTSWHVWIDGAWSWEVPKKKWLRELRTNALAAYVIQHTQLFLSPWATWPSRLLGTRLGISAEHLDGQPPWWTQPLKNLVSPKICPPYNNVAETLGGEMWGVMLAKVCHSCRACGARVRIPAACLTPTNIAI